MLIFVDHFHERVRSTIMSAVPVWSFSGEQDMNFRNANNIIHCVCSIEDKYISRS